MTFFWILCIWTVAGLPVGMLVGSMISNVNAEEALSQEFEMDLGFDMPVLS